MISLHLLVITAIIFFTYIGYVRGFSQELLVTLSLFTVMAALFYVDDELGGLFLAGADPTIRFVSYVAFMLFGIYLAYHSRTVVIRRGDNADRRRGSAGARSLVQDKALGAVIGFLNGYLIAGNIWYFLEINRGIDGQYALAPYVTTPPLNSASAQFTAYLPLTILTQGGENMHLLFLFLVVTVFLLLALR